jgi:hypothetical protein
MKRIVILTEDEKNYIIDNGMRFTRFFRQALIAFKQAKFNTEMFDVENKFGCQRLIEISEEDLNMLKTNKINITTFMRIAIVSHKAGLWKYNYREV